MERREYSVQSAENGRGGGVLTRPGRFAESLAHVDSVHTQTAAPEDGRKTSSLWRINVNAFGGVHPWDQHGTRVLPVLCIVREFAEEVAGETRDDGKLPSALSRLTSTEHPEYMYGPPLCRGDENPAESTTQRRRTALHLYCSRRSKSFSNLSFEGKQMGDQIDDLLRRSSNVSSRFSRRVRSAFTMITRDSCVAATVFREGILRTPARPSRASALPRAFFVSRK